jgi:hypothetical protein
MPNSYPQRIICILGMHRSGTSCLTGSLQQCGLELGEHSTWNLHNTKGNRENQQVVDFHEQVLADNNGSWHTPPAKICWTENHKEQALSILKTYSDILLWGFKDPRVLLMLEQWQSLKVDMDYIGIFRHPYAVARSINKRGSGVVSFKTGIEAWYKYNIKLLAEYKRSPFPVLCFDDPEDIFHEKMYGIINNMGLSHITDEEPFYYKELKTNEKYESYILTWKVKRLYKKLTKISV